MALPSQQSMMMMAPYYGQPMPMPFVPYNNVGGGGGLMLDFTMQAQVHHQMQQMQLQYQLLAAQQQGGATLLPSTMQPPPSFNHTVGPAINTEPPPVGSQSYKMFEKSIWSLIEEEGDESSSQGSPDPSTSKWVDMAAPLWTPQQRQLDVLHCMKHNQLGLIQKMNCGGGTHLHLYCVGGLEEHFVFCGRNGATTGVLKVVGRSIELAPEKRLDMPIKADQGKWRNAAVQALAQDLMDNKCLRIACVKVHTNHVELMIAKEPLLNGCNDFTSIALGNKSGPFPVSDRL